jgi:hypothetical protein
MSQHFMKINYDQDPVPVIKLNEALSSLERMIGRAFADNLRSNMIKVGIDLSDENQSYFLHELREVLDVIFGTEAAELLIERIRKELTEK